jgi:HPt (histidine-containing phosphotransfer) domain-containing protein
MGKTTSSEPLERQVDLEVLRTATSGDRDLMQELAALYVGDCDLKVRALDDALANGELDRIRQIGHALKGASQSVGALPAAEVFARLEEAGRRGDRPTILEAIEASRSAFDQVRRALAELR